MHFVGTSTMISKLHSGLIEELKTLIVKEQSVWHTWNIVYEKET